MKKDINLLLAGCGDIGIRIARQLADTPSLTLWGMRRNPALLPKMIRPLSADLSDPGCLADDWPVFDLVIATAVPGAGSDRKARYQSGYVQFAQNLTKKLNRQKQKSFVFWTSSTSVYSGLAPQCITEATAVKPGSETGEMLVVAEEIIMHSELPHCIIRPAGIYGPGRYGLLNSALKARPPENPVAGNRIHSEDCAGALAHLARKVLAGETLRPCYLLTDGQAVSRSLIIGWLRDQMTARGLESSDEKSGQTNSHGHTIVSEALLQSGYQFKYPNWQKGYAELLDAFVETALQNGAGSKGGT